MYAATGGTSGKERILDIGRRSTIPHSVKNWLWQRLRTCRKTACVIYTYMNMQDITNMHCTHTHTHTHTHKLRAKS